MTVKELKAYLSSIPEDTNIIIKDLEGKLIVENIGLNTIQVPAYFSCIAVKSGTKNVFQLEILVS